MKSNEANRGARQVVAVAYFLTLAVILGACGGPSNTDVSEELQETIVEEAVGEMDPIIADAVNEAVEDCER